MKGYQATPNGKIVGPRKELKQYTHDNGYQMVSIRGRYVPVHRLVAEQLIPNPHNKPLVHHCNGNRGDNRVGNLVWLTEREHKWIHNPTIERHGSRNGQAKLDAADILSIHRLVALGGGYRKIAASAGIHPSHADRIIRGKRWGHIAKEFNNLDL